MKPENLEACTFTWADLGDIDTGRPNLGQEVPVIVYRLGQYALREAIALRYGNEVAAGILRDAGWIAGREYCRNALDVSLPPAAFVDGLQKSLAELRVGVLRLEHVDAPSLTMTMTVSEDLDCSGLPVTGTTVCDYDEGFIAGILHAYLGVDFHVQEIDCWATGDRTCRFSVQPEPSRT
ncbi:MAG: 4-vinyl reductase [bacterium]|nr:4-vinyl reductase [bacterium]